MITRSAVAKRGDPTDAAAAATTTATMPLANAKRGDRADAAAATMPLVNAKHGDPADAAAAMMPLTNAERSDSADAAMATMPSANAKRGDPADVVAVTTPVANDALATSERSNEYKQQALAFLRFIFPKVSVNAIRQSFEHCRHSFIATYHILSAINKSVDVEDEDEKHQACLEAAPFLHDTKRIILKSNRVIASYVPTDQTLLDELDTIPEMNMKEGHAVGTSEVQVQDEEVNDSKQAPKQLLETCVCCFDNECLFVDMAQCTKGHLVCSNCLRHYVHEQLDGNGKCNFQCMHVDACTGTYNTTQIDKVFSPKARENVHDKIFRFDFQKANMSDGCQCPNPDCNYLFVVDGCNEVSCPDCGHAFCRLCKAAPHVHKSCDEAAAEKENLDKFNSTANAMTAVTVRKCPNCYVAFTKETGCNQMTCPQCKTLSCYLCRKEITGNEHFCRTPFCTHESCRKCVLFGDFKKADQRARKEVAQSHLEDAGAGAETLIGRLLTSPQKEERNSFARPPLDLVRQGHGHPQVANVAPPAPQRQRPAGQRTNELQELLQEARRHQERSQELLRRMEQHHRNAVQHQERIQAIRSPGEHARNEDSEDISRHRQYG